MHQLQTNTKVCERTSEPDDCTAYSRTSAWKQALSWSKESAPLCNTMKTSPERNYRTWFEGPIHTGRGTQCAQIRMYFLWCCLRAVWTLPFTSTGPIWLRRARRRVPRPMWIGPKHNFRLTEPHSFSWQWSHWWNASPVRRSTFNR